MSNISGVLLVSVMGLTLNGCEAIHMYRVVSVAKDGQNCTEKIYSSSEYARLSAKGHFLSLNNSGSSVTAEPTPSQLDDNAYATDDETIDLASVHNNIASCRAELIPKMADTDPYLIPAILKAFEKSDDIYMDLITKKITWGQSTRKKMTLASSFKKEFMDGISYSKSRRDKETDEQFAKAGKFASGAATFALNVALTALSAWAMSQQATYRAYQPSRLLITNCTSYAGSINCITQ